MKKIGMVVALRKEVLPFLEESGAKMTMERVGKYSVCRFELGEKELFIVESGIGEIYASGATQMLITKYGVEGIINFGVCGSLVEEIEVLHTVLVEGIVHYDFDLTAIDPVEVGQYPGMDVVIPCKNELMDLAKSLRPEVKGVICASADKFVADEGIKEDLHERFGASICEMECAGVALTCMNNEVPFLVLKAVSDGKGGAEEFMEMVKQASKAYISFVYEILEKI